MKTCYILVDQSAKASKIKAFKSDTPGFRKNLTSRVAKKS